MNLIGKEINGYKFEQALGSGSFGAVYKVLKNGVYYAAKVLSEMYVLDEFKNEDNRITREIQILKKATNNNLIRYEEDFHFKNEFGVIEYVIVMEYFQGTTLKEFINNTTELNELVEVFLKILDGVNSLHKIKIENEGIIHRDLKPANILVNSKNEIKIIDYGLSKIIDFSTITSTGNMIGSPLYMSPEQLTDSKHIDYRSDIYSLGIILYEMLTKNIPYKAQTIPELFLKIINEPIIPPKQFNINISNGLENIIYKATSKERFSRFQTVDEFIKAFTDKNIQSELLMMGKYYAWVYKEKGVTIDFEKVNNTSIIYPIHVQNWSKGLHKYFSNKKFENVIVDPSTQRLSYLAFASTVGLVDLPYAPEKGVISLEYLNNPVKRKDYIIKWYNTVRCANKLILPYHYISNTDYSVDKIDEWIKINVQLIDESSRIIEKDKEKYAMISIGLNHLIFQSEKILSYFVHANVDAFIVQVSDLKQLNEQSLKGYIDFMVNLQKFTNKPIIALKVPIALGLTLIAKGIHGFSLGLASIDYFDEQYIKEDKDSFNLYSKYYFPQLLSFLTYPKKDTFAFREMYDYFGGCECQWCKGKDAIEIGTGDKGVQLHFWQYMMEEVEEINKIESENKRENIKKRIYNAIDEFENIPKSIMGNLKNNDYYKLLKNIIKII